MFNLPHLNPAYTVQTVAPDLVFFISERNSASLQNQLYYELINLIDGKTNVDQIIDRLVNKFLSDPESTSEDLSQNFQARLNFNLKIQRALFELGQQGYILEQNQHLPEHLAILVHDLGINSQQASQRLNSTTVSVKALGNCSAEELIKILQSYQIQVVEQGDLTIVLVDDYLDPHLAEFNEQALNAKTPWLLAKPLGTQVWIGPLFIPQQTGCWQCFAKRWRDNQPVSEFIKRKNSAIASTTPPLGFSSATLQTALSMTAMEVFKWIIRSQQNEAIQGKIITFDTLHQQTQSHTLVRLPSCPSCGNPVRKEPLSIVLGHRQKVFTIDGGHRCCTPEETLAKYQHHISSITGIVRELVQVPDEGLIHNYIAKHHVRPIIDDLDSLQQNVQGRSAGKGKSATQAKVSAFCEAIERYSGSFHGDEISEKASYQQLGDRAIHPYHCLNFSQQQYQNRLQRNEKSSGWFQRIPEPFNEERVIDWTPVWSLTHEQFKYLPTAYCYFGYPQDFPLECWADSNGCAAGNTIEEAILQGFMELVERDCVALWWYNRLQKPQVDLASFAQPYFVSLQEYYGQIQRDLWVLDITSDLNIPCFVALSSRTDSPAADILLGFGAHFDPQIAISRALTEVNQMLPNVLSFKADGTTNYSPSADRLAIAWWQNATVENQPYLLPDQQLKIKTSHDYPRLDHDDLLEDIQLCQQIIEENGMEMLVLDQTRAEIGLRVVKVIVPHLRHMWRRLGEGRLYDVPVKMGWLSQPLSEEELNPLAMWM